MRLYSGSNVAPRKGAQSSLYTSENGCSGPGPGQFVEYTSGQYTHPVEDGVVE